MLNQYVVLLHIFPLQNHRLYQKFSVTASFQAGCHPPSAAHHLLPPFLQKQQYYIYKKVTQNCQQPQQLSASSSPSQQPFVVNQTAAEVSSNVLSDPWTNIHTFFRIDKTIFPKLVVDFKARFMHKPAAWNMAL